jgi:hypothetical protein
VRLAAAAVRLAAAAVRLAAVRLARAVRLAAAALLRVDTCDNGGVKVSRRAAAHGDL